MPITESQRVIMIIRNSIPCYVYIDNILIAQAESALQLSKITGASTSAIARCINKKSNLYGKFTITRLCPTFTTYQNLYDSKDLRNLFVEARKVTFTANENPTSIPMIVIDTLDFHKEYFFSSSFAAAKFTSTNHNRSISHTTVRKLLNTQRTFKG